MLTTNDRQGKRVWLVVGRRAADDRLVLDEALTRTEAEALAGVYRACLEGYDRIDVERIGR